MTTKTESKSNTPSQWSFIHFFKRFFIQIVIIVLLLLAFGFFELGRYTVYRSHPNLYTQDQASAVLKNISLLIQLPKGTPTMAIISNAASIKKAQPFLADANNGDILIVYKSAGEAILYRPSVNKLISVGPIYKSKNTSKNVSRKTSQKASGVTAQTQSKSTSQTQHATTSQKK